MAENENELQSTLFDDCSPVDFIFDQGLKDIVKTQSTQMMPSAAVKGKPTFTISIPAPPNTFIKLSCRRLKQPDGSIKGEVTLLLEPKPHKTE